MTNPPAPARVLYLTTSGQVGGAERCLISLIGGLDRSRFSPLVLIGSEGPLEDMLAGVGVPAQVVALPAGMKQLSRYHANRGAWARVAPLMQAPGYLARLRRAGLGFQPHLVHSNGFKMHYIAALLKPVWGARTLWHLHDFPAQARSGREPWPNRLLHRLGGTVDLAVANSHAVAEAYRARLPRLGPKLRVVYNGVNVDAFAAGNGAGMRRRWGIPPEAPVIGMVAIFAPWKGHEVFLRAAQRVHAECPEARFVLVGDDIYDTTGHGGRRAELEARARDLGLHACVHFTGFVGDEIASAYAALDVMVHASTAPEPFGRTLIEAMAAGVSVVAARGGGVNEIVVDGSSGLLTPPGDDAELAHALMRLMRDPDMRTRLAAGGRERVCTEFSEAVVARAMTRCYAELL